MMLNYDKKDIRNQEEERGEERGEVGARDEPRRIQVHL